MHQKLTILVGGVAITHFSGSTHSKISDHELEFLNLTLTQQIFIPHSIKLGIYLPVICKPQRVACNVNNQSSSSVSESQESGITSGMSPKIFKELSDNVKEPFPLHMSSWQRDSTRFRTIFTGHDGETLLSPHTFAKLVTLVDELSKSISINTG